MAVSIHPESLNWVLDTNQIRVFFLLLSTDLSLTVKSLRCKAFFTLTVREWIGEQSCTWRLGLSGAANQKATGHFRFRILCPMNRKYSVDHRKETKRNPSVGFVAPRDKKLVKNGNCDWCRPSQLCACALKIVSCQMDLFIVFIRVSFPRSATCVI